MKFLTCAEAERALVLADLFCRRADEDKEVTVSSVDLELVALGLFLIVHVSGHAQQIPEFTAGKV